MKALEIWINGERRCVAGTGDHVLNAIVNATLGFRLTVGGIIEKDGESFHVDWLGETFQIGDEVRVRFIETDEVDEPSKWKPRKTQAQKDDEVRTHLEWSRDSLPAPLVETATSSLLLLNERLAQNNFVAAMEILGELGKQNVVSVPFWDSLGRVASLLSRYESAATFRAQKSALEAQGE